MNPRLEQNPTAYDERPDAGRAGAQAAASASEDVLAAGAQPLRGGLTMARDTQVKVLVPLLLLALVMALAPIVTRGPRISAPAPDGQAAVPAADAWGPIPDSIVP